ncbi:unnamed protein product [Lymnaea stagnalis]|uniref:Uncharacterized protein n=1 Tax=Lymnaea stagnalis TaxID=6523 RepID=A0AAV2HIX3_LYMST
MPSREGPYPLRKCRGRTIRGFRCNVDLRLTPGKSRYCRWHALQDPEYADLLTQNGNNLWFIAVPVVVVSVILFWILVKTLGIPTLEDPTDETIWTESLNELPL